jgi:hypothetical protein
MNSTLNVPGPTESSTSKIVKIVGIVILVGVVLCGLVGSCLLVVTFLLPLAGVGQ